ncbi:amine acid ABC transporter, permease protein, 3-TM region, His/Glu/Gln/Arg/opine family [Streptococcus equinus]|uniref:Amine acid ABC transporter, permease protein, 3-TM region, His/Glu/Gln/Arg/opine family n=1 Tax=Streptococcus equinus TaxID=1335 RepID=A0A1H0M8N7_STREI|nr:ABC transporter permease subunit [Streptococcus equinus]SDO76829.1 amine acid ABC transporter, permease protein, 3-TM region, His/Glu/Gln/Arg/opine family [Streptococcus equinus]
MFGGFLESYGGFILDGALMTVFLSVVSMILALILGGLVTAARMSDNLLISGLTKLYIEVVRGLPMLVILSLFFYGLPELGLNIPKGTLFGVDLDRLIAALTGLTVGESVFVAEIYRSGIQAVDSGQFEGARSIGFNKFQAYRYVIIPQAFKNILPTLGNEFANNIKSSSQASVIGVADLMFTASTIQGISYKPFQAVIAVGIVYLVFTFSTTRIVAHCEKKMNRSSEESLSLGEKIAQFLQSIKSSWRKLTVTTAVIAVIMGLFALNHGRASQAASGISKIQESGQLVVATNIGYAPYEFYDLSSGHKKAVGVDLAFAKQLADKLQVKLVVKNMNFDSILGTITSGNADIAIAGMTKTKEREKSVDFTKNYVKQTNKVIVRKEFASQYTSIKSLAPTSIAVQKSTTQADVVKDSIKPKQIVALTSLPDAFLNLLQGKVDAVVADDMVADQYIASNSDLTYADIELPGTTETAMALTKGNQSLKAYVDDLIEQDKKDGTFDNWMKTYSNLAQKNTGENE